MGPLEREALFCRRTCTLGTPLVAQRVKHLPAVQETGVQSLGREDPLEKEMVTHSSILAWRVPWMEEPGGLQSTGSQSRTRLSNFAFTGGLVIKNPPSSAEDVGSIFGQETKILHATGPLTPHSSTTEPICCRAHVLQQKPEGRNWREAPHCI